MMVNKMSNSKLKILFLTNIPSPYRVHFFNELGRMCELTVLYQKGTSSERNSKWIAKSENTYKSVFLKGNSTGVDNAFCPGVIKYLNRGYDAIIICGNASPTEILAIEWCRLRRIPYCMEADGAFVKEGNGFKEKLKKHLISGGSLFFSTCSEHDKYYLHYGAKPENIRRYKFSSLLERDIIASPVSEDEKKSLRVELGMQEEKIVLAVGQFIHRKGFDVLLDAAVMFKENIGVYIVGDKPTNEYTAKVKAHNLTNVHFEGFKSKEELKKYYMAANLFVLPTREDIWGLVVNEAMAYGVPVVTTDRCNAGLELIKNGENGFIVKTENSEELSKKICLALGDYAAMGEKALKDIRKYTIEEMAADHIRILQESCNG